MKQTKGTRLNFYALVGTFCSSQNIRSDPQHQNNFRLIFLTAKQSRQGTTVSKVFSLNTTRVKKMTLIQRTDHF
jgi:hypothetical protein